MRFLLRSTGLALFFLAVLLPLTQADAQDANQAASREQTDAVDALFATWDRKDSPGCAIAIIRDGKVIYQRGYGLACVEHDIPITTTTRFNVASVSKQFTVFLIFLLADAGLISLDDDIRDHLPDLPEFGKKITVRHLIHHTSGLRDFFSPLHWAGWREEDVLLKKDSLAFALRQKTLNFEPGAEYAYSNTGYLLLGMIAEKVGKKSFATLAKEKIFDPLGMKHTLVLEDHRSIVKNAALCYNGKDNDQYERLHYASDEAGASNVFTCVEDLALWDQNFYTGKVGGAKVLQQMVTVGVLNSGDRITYAGGLGVSEFRGLKTVRHSGWHSGYRSHFMRFPDQKFSVIILANVRAIDPRLKAEQVAEIFLKDQLQPKPNEVSVPEEVLKKYEGDYYFPLDTPLTFSSAKGKLHVQAANAKKKNKLIAVSATEFVDPLTDLWYQFEEEGRTVVYRSRGTFEQFGKRMEPAKLSAEEARQMVGKYFSEELNVFYTIRLDKNGKLRVVHPRGEEALTFVMPGDYRLSLEGSSLNLHFNRNGNGAVTGFAVNTWRARNVPFVRVTLTPES
jgi:CubicO group peptidase (beta-lactamase class C family)